MALYFPLRFFDVAVQRILLGHYSYELGNRVYSFEKKKRRFGAGTVELVGAFTTQNPLLLVSGGEHIIAGIVSAWKTFTIHIDLVPFFGATFASALLGFVTAKYLCKNDMYDSIQKSVKSGMITALFQLSTSFGYGAAICCAYMEYAKYIAKRDSEQIARVMKVDKQYYEKFTKVLDSFEDKKVKNAYTEFDNYIANRIAAVNDTSILGEKRLNVAMAALYSNTSSEIKKQLQGDFLVNYLEQNVA